MIGVSGVLAEVEGARTRIMEGFAGPGVPGIWIVVGGGKATGDGDLGISDPRGATRTKAGADGGGDIGIWMTCSAGVAGTAEAGSPVCPILTYWDVGTLSGASRVGS